MTTNTRREQATQEFEEARDAVNTLFDRHDALGDALGRAAEPLNSRTNESDELQAAATLIAAAEAVASAVDALQAAARTASAHKSKSDLAAAIGTKTVRLFPRPAAKPKQPDPFPVPLVDHPQH